MTKKTKNSKKTSNPVKKSKKGKNPMKQQPDTMVPGLQLKPTMAVEVLKEPAVVPATKEQMVLPVKDPIVVPARFPALASRICVSIMGGKPLHILKPEVMSLTKMPKRIKPTQSPGRVKAQESKPRPSSKRPVMTFEMPKPKYRTRKPVRTVIDLDPWGRAQSLTIFESSIWDHALDLDQFSIVFLMWLNSGPC